MKKCVCVWSICHSHMDKFLGLVFLTRFSLSNQGCYILTQTHCCTLGQATVTAL